jgi:hypothetical protein
VAASRASGWTRHDTSQPVAPTYRENPRAAHAAAAGREVSMLALAKARAHMIVASSVELYREMALSALSLLRRL